MLKNKVIWIINQYASTPETSMGGRHYYLAVELSKLGYDVYLIAASYTHILRRPPKMDGKFVVQKINENFKVVWVEVNQYTNAHSAMRVVNWFLFSWKLRFLPKHIDQRPDVVLCSSPSLVSFIGAERLSKKFNAKLIFEVRDIWPLTLMHVGRKSKNNFFIKFLSYIERRAYRNADLVFSNLENSVEHMKSQGMSPEKFHWIANGVSEDEVSNPLPLPTSLSDALPKNKFIIGYVGTIGDANALNILLDAASDFKDLPDVAFVIVGSGKNKTSLIDYANKKGIGNVFFYDAISKQQVQSLLSLFDVCYIGWKKEELYRFGIAPNKLAEYMYASKPVLHSFSGFGDIVQRSGCGITVPAEDVDAVVQGLRQLYLLSGEQRAKMGELGKKYVLINNNYSKLAEKMVSKIF